MISRCNSAQPSLSYAQDRVPRKLLVSCCYVVITAAAAVVRCFVLPKMVMSVNITQM
jgi:hypothetical protein